MESSLIGTKKSLLEILPSALCVERALKTFLEMTLIVHQRMRCRVQWIWILLVHCKAMTWKRCLPLYRFTPAFLVLVVFPSCTAAQRESIGDWLGDEIVRTMTPEVLREETQEAHDMHVNIGSYDFECSLCRLR